MSLALATGRTLEITARQIADWAGGKAAHAELPRYIRRLIHEVGSIAQIAVPAGASTSQPGWDGELTSEHGNAWVPKGRSFWEMSCEAQVTSKANDDFSKRTKGTPEHIRKTTTLVIVTAKRWSQKGNWLAKKQTAADWSDIRAYDADDLEQWLEQAPAVKLRFGDQIDLTGHGVEDVERHWANWAGQTDVTITPEAFFVDREAARDRFIAGLRKRLSDRNTQPLTIRADSVEEAAAFAAAVLQDQPDLCSASLVVTDPAGWRFVEQNTSLQVAIAARPEIAERPTRREGTIAIIPYAAGDMTGHFRSAAGREDESEITLERPNLHQFEKALVSIGLDEGDAKRLASSTGRSWSVLRRRRALNPSIRRPAWLDAPQATSLSTLCLLGGWTASRPADRSIVAELARRDYEYVERDLRHLSQLDDAPILEIGEVWKAKSPLELLDLFGGRITRDELDRFFQIASRVLIASDPELELPEDQRYAAQIYGKVRPESLLLIRAICDTIVKLSVRGLQVPALAAAQVDARASGLVKDLLAESDGVRWLSLSSVLPDLAEAAPETFIKCVEASLTKTDMPVARLLTETGGSPLMGRCWHAGLLWALERLAWAPERLTRVALLLARLTPIEIKGNWGNSPRNTLVDLFRSWLPQTAAHLDQRMAAIDILVQKEPEVAFELLNRLVNVGPDSATPSARPNWRDEDAGAGRGVPNGEQHEMLVAAADKLIACARGKALQVAKLLEKLSIFDPARISATLALAEEFVGPAAQDDDKETLREVLRTQIHSQRNYGSLRGAALESRVGRLEGLYRRLAPANLIARHRWLLSNGWPSLPTRVRDDDHLRQSELIEATRLEAVKEIYDASGLDGIEQMAISVPNFGYVGASLAKLDLPARTLSKWIVEKGGDFSSRTPMFMAIRGLLRVSKPDRAGELIAGVINQAQLAGWHADRIAQFLSLADDSRATWNIVSQLGQEVDDAYWKVCGPGFWIQDNEVDLAFALRRLVAAGRPRSALHVCHFNLAKVEPLLLADMLESMLRGEETDGPLLDSYYIDEALDRLEQSGALDRDRLVRLGFGLIPALGHKGEHRAASLYSALMADAKLFTELLCLLYRPATREREEPVTESTRAAADIAWRVLHNCQRQPGTQADGRIDPGEFVRFIDEARKLCQEADRLGVCDSALGQILAQAGPDADGVWPSEPVRDVLDRAELEEMRRGFVVGAMNKRGVTSRAYDDGGRQERELAATYRAHARALHNSHVHVASALEQLASWYENDGLRADQQARLRREGH